MSRETSTNGGISRPGSALLPMATDEDTHEREATAVNTEASALEKLGEITTSHGISYDDNLVSPAESYLGAYETLRGNITVARAHFRKNMLTAHEILSDDTDQNDADAYFVLFQCLLHTGDDIDALIAFELTGSIEKTVEMRLGEIRDEDKIATTELLDFSKETFSPNDAVPTRGTWDFETDINICKYCWDTPFCQNCLPLLQQGSSKMLACDARHKWLRVPRWNLRESTGLRDGTIMMRGEIVDGRHVGGQRVKIKEWLSTIWKEWDIE
ncbi:hypothetical protein F25303_1394 [Fusarium sp. NRRL 25303]|nr:hypothetical protein F25303_1394 [Fusarium sp. NRRL 25303]